MITFVQTGIGLGVSSNFPFLNALSFLASSIIIFRLLSRSSFKSNLRLSALARKEKAVTHGCLNMIVTAAQIYTAIALFNTEISVVLMLKNKPTWKLKIQSIVLTTVARRGIFRQSENEEKFPTMQCHGV